MGTDATDDGFGESVASEPLGVGIDQSLLQYSWFRRIGRLTPSKGGEAVVTWNGLLFAVAFAMLVLAIVAFNGKDRP